MYIYIKGRIHKSTRNLKVRSRYKCMDWGLPLSATATLKLKTLSNTPFGSTEYLKILHKISKNAE